MWFCYGMVIFSFTWLKIISLVQVRFLQYFSKKEKGVSEDHMTQSMKRVSMATKSGLRDKNVRNPLSTALGTYFCIWMVYPLLWLLREVCLHIGSSRPSARASPALAAPLALLTISRCYLEAPKVPGS